MELPAKYNPSETEDKWYAYWLENKFFHSEPDEREPYTVVIPPLMLRESFIWAMSLTTL